MVSPTPRLLADLEAQGLLPPAQAAAIAEDERTRPFSLHYELRALLYLGITLLVGGLGVLVYQHLDSIGHSVIVGAITLAMSASFAYAERHRPAFTWGQAPRPPVAAEYLLLLSCLLFLVLEGYLQAQYGFFGTRYGLAAALPALLFLPLAYRFDHRGVLSLGLTAVGAWLSVRVAPLAVLRGAFDQHLLAGPALGLGLVLVAAGLASEYGRRKAHFGFTYLLTGANLAGLGLLWQAFGREGWAVVPWLLLLLGLAAGLGWYGRRTQSYLFLLLGVAYGYVAITSLLVLLLGGLGWGDFWPLLLLYLPLSLLGVVLLFSNIKKILRLA